MPSLFSVAVHLFLATVMPGDGHVCRIVSKHPDTPREAVCVCEDAVSVFLIEKVGDPLRVRTGSAPDKSDYQGVIWDCSRAYPQWITDFSD